MPPTAALVSFRLGGPDGVSVQAATWGRALERLGYNLRRVAGDLADGPRSGDVVLPGLGVAAATAPGPDGQRPAGVAPPAPEVILQALAGCDVVVVENLLSLPLNLAAADVLAEALGRLLQDRSARVVLHHHDLAWQRPETAHIRALPPRLPGALHVTINDFSRSELARRGFEAVTVRNAFDLDAPPGRREAARGALGAGPGDLVVLQPTRAIARKNIPAALALAAGLAERRSADGAVIHWLPGPAEDGYAPVLERMVAGARVPVVLTRPGDLRLTGAPAPGSGSGGVPRKGTMADAYAACDLVVFPSTSGEGFGQPVIESVWARRPLAVARYPALEEILALGFRFLPAGDPAAVAAALECPDEAGFDANLALARAHFSLDALTDRLRLLL
jgi:glycosyltransferase involved in cell wall biosynthesis